MIPKRERVAVSIALQSFFVDFWLFDVGPVFVGFEKIRSTAQTRRRRPGRTPSFFGDIFGEGEAGEMVSHTAVHFDDVWRQCFAVVELVARNLQREVISYHSGDKGCHVRGVGNDVAPGVL